MALNGLLRSSCILNVRNLGRWSIVTNFRTDCYRNQSSLSRLFTLNEEAKTALKQIPDIKHAPAPALIYGVGGLIPFTTIPAYMLNTGVYIPELVYANLAYGAVILSFLGGIRWGVTVSQSKAAKSEWANLTWSIIPSLIAWSSLLVDNTNGLVLAASGFLLCLIQDLKNPYYPSWFKSLRILLSSVVICTLFATLLCHHALPIETKSRNPQMYSEMN